MTKRFCCLVALAIVVAAGASTAEARPIPCASGCKIHLQADSHVQRWETRFHPSWVDADVTSIGATVDGHWLQGYQRLGCCMAEWSGKGVSLKVDARGGRFRLSWVSWGRPTPLTLSFRF